MREVTAGQAVLAAGIVAGLYAAGRPYRTVAGLVVLAVLLAPGPNGQGVLSGLIGYVTGALRGTLQR